MYYLVLASSSPRRKEILKKSHLFFQTFSVEISENMNENMSLDEALMELSRRKAEAVIETFGEEFLKPSIVLSADTVVVYENEVLGKPKDQEEARVYLERMSGSKHLVKTAFCLWNQKTAKMITEVETSEVFFKTLEEETITRYIQTEEPYDKAGGYGIQGEGRNFVDKYTGSFYNIMGLPIEKILEISKELNWNLKEEN